MLERESFLECPFGNRILPLGEGGVIFPPGVGNGVVLLNDDATLDFGESISDLEVAVIVDWWLLYRFTSVDRTMSSFLWGEMVVGGNREKGAMSIGELKILVLCSKVSRGDSDLSEITLLWRSVLCVLIAIRRSRTLELHKLRSCGVAKNCESRIERKSAPRKKC